MKIRLPAAFWCGSFVVTFSTAPWTVAHGQDTQLTTLQTITVQGESLLEELPPGSTVTDRLDLQKRSITDWTDFSKRATPSVNFNRNNNSVNIRGMDADRVVTTIDGIRLPWLTDGARGVEGGLNAVPFSSLSSVQVTGSAGTAHSGALTGAISLQTLSPEDLIEPGRDFGALLNSGYDTADDSWRASATLAGRFPSGTRWLLHMGTRRGHELQNYEGKKGYGPDRIRTTPQNYRQNNILLKLDHNLTSEHQIEFQAERFRRHTDIDNRRAQGEDSSFLIGRNNTRENVDRDRISLGYNYESEQKGSLLSHGYLKPYWQRVRLKSKQDSWRTPDGRGNIIPGDPFNYRYPFDAYQRDNLIQESGFGVATQWAGYLDGVSVRHHWSAGADWYGSRVRQDSSGLDNCPPSFPSLPAPFGPRSCDLLHTGQADMPNVKGNAWSVWLQDEISWQDGQYALRPGVRFDAYDYQPQHSSSYQQNPNSDITALNSNNSSRVSPSLLATYRPTETVLMYANYSYGFKAPNPAQLYLNYGAPGTYLNVGNPDLKPETSHGWELGIEAGDARLNGRVVVFNNRYNNFIDSISIGPADPNWNPAWDGQYPMGVSGTVNRARVRIYGAEASGHWQITRQWYTRAAIAWVRGKDMNANRPLNSVPPLKTTMAFGYETGSWGFETMFSAVKRHSRVENDDDFKAPGYGITDLNAWWSPPSVKGLRIHAGIHNVFDKKYWDALNVARTGRDIALSTITPNRDVHFALC